MEESNFFVQFRRYSWIGAVALFLLALTFFVYQKREAKQERIAKQDYQTATCFSAALLSGKEPSKESLDQMNDLLKRHPHLAPTFECKLALALFAQGEQEKGGSVAQRAMVRPKPFDADSLVAFSKISLLLEQGKREEAKIASLAFEEKFASNPSIEHLRAFNLLRLFFLTKDSHYLESLKRLSAYAEIQSLFHSGSFLLENFACP